MVNKWADTLRNLGTSINTPQPEMYPCISADTETIYFTRRMNGIDEDFYKAQLDSCGGWLYARNLGTPPNTSAQEASQMISADGHYLFFMRCETRSENGWANGGCDLFMAYTADSTWSIPQSFGATINTPGCERPRGWLRRPGYMGIAVCRWFVAGTAQPGPGHQYHWQ
jgi:hypothetical protein